MPYLGENVVSMDPVPGGIEITDAEYAQALEALLAGQRIAPRDGALLVYSGESRTVFSTDDGRALDVPVEDEVPAGHTDQEPQRPCVWDGSTWVPDTAALAAEARLERDARLARADWLIERAIDNGDDVAPLRAYRQALRDVPEQPGFPETFDWPEEPAA